MSHIRRFLRNAEGLTLVETMIAIAVSSIVLAAIAAAMATGAKSWRSTSSAAAMSRQADAALAAIVSKVRIANDVYLLAPDSLEAIVFRETGEYRYAFTLTHGNIIMKITNPDGTTSSGMVGSDIVLMQVAHNGEDSYEIKVTCADTETSKTASTRVTLRR